MVTLLHYALPALLLLYFVWRSFRQRIFLLGVPFLMYQHLGVFFDYLPPFWMPGRLSTADHLMIWLAIVWVVYFELVLPSRRRADPRPRVFGPSLSAPEEVVLLGLAALATLEVALTVSRFGDISATMGEAKAFVYLFAGYFLMRGMLCRASRSDTVDLVGALVVVNTIAAGLFILHQGLHIPIYVVEEYLSITFMGQPITRSFYFMPQLLILALAFCFAKPRWSVFWVGVMMVTLAAVWVSYTRMLLVATIAVFVVVLGVRVFKARQVGQALRRAVAVLALVAVFGAVAYVALPVQSQYFLMRIVKTTRGGTVVADENLQNRMGKLQRTYLWIGSESHALGQGFVTVEQEPTAADILWMRADLVWVPVLYRMGLIGVATVLLIYAVAGWRALRMSLSGEGDAEFLAIVLLGTVVGTLIEGMTAFGFLSPTRYPMGFWLFAFLAAEACRRRAERALALPVTREEPHAVA